MDLVSGRRDKPVNLNSRDSEGFTLLMRALQQPSPEGELVDFNNNTLRVIKHLLDSGVDPEARSPDGTTAFEMAVQCNNWPAILALLPRCEVKIGDNVLLTGTQYLHELAKQKDICEEKLRSFTKCLLEHDLNINELDSDYNSPLILAAKQQNWNYVVVLLQHGAEAKVNVDNQSLLHFVIANHRDIPHVTLTSLLDAMQGRGIDFNSLDYEGKTILFTTEVYSSISSGQDPSGSLFRMLVNRGANPLAADSEGHSLLRFALDVNEDFELNLLKFLVQTGITTYQPALTEAARTRMAVSASVYSTPSPTQAAFKVEDVQALKLLVESGASNNRELFELSLKYEKKIVTNKTRVKTEMMDILKHAASQPRSLKSLCRLTVSHALGCGTRREEKVTCLPVPQRLQQYILFHDILSEELQTPEEISHHKLSRGNRGMFTQPFRIFVCCHGYVLSRSRQRNVPTVRKH
ncbi:hypothetical protein C0Q70_04740 [Pomacea canaliculata]|uniref:SOCS box domain-containing protein n=1 Tax=Pomacea canaliculata TaxID=400727 RepID=A0A2T7PJ91_POMCA|nr:uncharacterized protein LOC112559915 [Pomacea canaliculata]PVD33484.1 hypothetical protein C0Q70_04740 [Pomacea canaliculata]